MIKRLITLFKLGRKLAKSDALTIASKFNEPPIINKVLFKFYLFLLQMKKLSIKTRTKVKNYHPSYNQWVQHL